MLKKRIIITLTFLDGILYRTKYFKPDYRYTKNFIDFWSIDELILIDISKKKFSDSFMKIINYFCANCFVPLTVGGGIKTIDDADLYFKNGADKVLLGTNAIYQNNLIKDIKDKYGVQAIIQSIDCKKKNYRKLYTVMSNSGETDLEIDPIEFGKISLENGIGEILINNIDNDGSLLGFDTNLISMISKYLKCPIIALGGGGNWDHFLDVFTKTDISAVSSQNIFHFTEESVRSLKIYLETNNIDVRK